MVLALPAGLLRRALVPGQRRRWLGALRPRARGGRADRGGGVRFATWRRGRRVYFTFASDYLTKYQAHAVGQGARRATSEDAIAAEEGGDGQVRGHVQESGGQRGSDVPWSRCRWGWSSRSCRAGVLSRRKKSPLSRHTRHDQRGSCRTRAQVQRAGARDVRLGGGHAPVGGVRARRSLCCSRRSARSRRALGLAGVRWAASAVVVLLLLAVVFLMRVLVRLNGAAIGASSPRVVDVPRTHLRMDGVTAGRDGVRLRVPRTLRPPRGSPWHAVGLWTVIVPTGLLWGMVQEFIYRGLLQTGSSRVASAAPRACYSPTWCSRLARCTSEYFGLGTDAWDRGGACSRRSSASACSCGILYRRSGQPLAPRGDAWAVAAQHVLSFVRSAR